MDGCDAARNSFASPSLSLPEYRSGMQIALSVGIAGLYFKP